MEYAKLISSLSVYKNFEKDYMSGRLSQAYLFVCDDRLTAKVLMQTIANLLVCENNNICEVCGACIKARAGTHPDILMYPKAKSFMVEDAGDIYDKVQVKPMLANKKIFLINDIDLSTEQAQNKMLKIIEEPPENVIFLLSAKNENKVLKTIQSRVQKNYIDKIKDNFLSSVLVCSEEIRDIAISNGGGYLGKTLDIQNNEEYINIYKNAKNIVIKLKNSSQIPNFSPQLAIGKDFFEKSLYILNDFFRDLLMLKLNKESLIKNKNLIDDFYLIIEEYSVTALTEILKRLNYCKQKFDANCNLTILADLILMEILEVKYLCK